MRDRRVERGGFTLVESMISLTLLGLLLLQIGLIQRAARIQLERTRRGTGTAAVLSSACRRFAADCAHFQVPGFLAPGEPVMDLTQVGGDGGQGGGAKSSVGFYVAEWTPYGLQEVRKVEYTVDGDGLARYSRPAVAGNQDLAPERRELLVPGVTGFTFKLAAGTGQWVPTWVGRKGVPSGLAIAFNPGQSQPDVVWARYFSGVYLEAMPP